jgi:tetratricopeptide (TPR) repeat protein
MTRALVAAVSLAVLAGGAEAQVLSRDWKQAKTASLTVVGDAKAEDLQRIALNLGRFRDALSGLLPAVRLDDATPMTVMVFRDDGAMQPFKPRSRGRTLSYIDAQFLPVADANYVVMAAVDAAPSNTATQVASGAPLATLRFGHQNVYRGYALHVLRQNYRRLPTWLAAGLVDFFGSFEVRVSDGRTVVGTAQRRHHVTLGRITALPLADLVPDDSAVRHLRDVNDARRYAASAWGLTHYLLVGQGGALRPALHAYLQAMETGESSAAAFARVFGTDVAPLEKAVADHLKLVKLPALVLASSSATPPAVTPMSEADALALRADLLVRQSLYADAEPWIDKALAIDPAHVGARLARGRSRLEQGDAAGALVLLAESGLAGDTRFEPVLLRADALRDAGRYPEAVAAYRIAVALRPTAPFAHYGMSLAMTGAGDPEAAAAFSRCLTLRSGADWFKARQRQALRLGLDGYVASDAINWVRANGWSEDEDASYVMLAKAFTELRQKKSADATATLTEIASHHQPGDWVLHVVAFLRGEIGDDVLLSRAKDDGQRTEAHAYAGIKANIDGDATRARTHLTWVQTSGRKEYIEYGYALGELQRMARAATP